MPGDGCYPICSLFTKVEKPEKQNVTSSNSTWLPRGSHELAPYCNTHMLLRNIFPNCECNDEKKPAIRQISTSSVDQLSVLAVLAPVS